MSGCSRRRGPRSAWSTRHGYRGPVARLDAGKVAAKLKALTKALPDGGPRAGDSYDAVVVEVSDAKNELLVDLGGWKGAVPMEVGGDRLNPQKKKPSERFAKNDLLRVRLAPDLPPP